MRKGIALDVAGFVAIVVLVRLLAGWI
jgi:hypothetical protein